MWFRVLAGLCEWLWDQRVGRRSGRGRGRVGLLGGQPCHLSVMGLPEHDNVHVSSWRCRRARQPGVRSGCRLQGEES